MIRTTPHYFPTTCALSALLLLLCAAPVHTRDDVKAPSTEYDVKAAFVYKLATFVDWPETLFDDEHQPLVIGILGQNPFGNVLDSLIVQKFIGSHALVIHRAKNFDELPYCHLLFVSQSEQQKISQILTRLLSFRTLTVCDLAPQTAPGIMVYLTMSEGRVRLAINNTRASAAGLNISSRVLRLAEIVTEEVQP